MCIKFSLICFKTQTNTIQCKHWDKTNCVLFWRFCVDRQQPDEESLAPPIHSDGVPSPDRHGESESEGCRGQMWRDSSHVRRGSTQQLDPVSLQGHGLALP